LCTNHPDAKGDIIAMPACSRCPNFRRRGERRIKAEVTNPIGPVVCQIPLTSGKVATVDASDYGWLSEYHWFVSATRPGSCYAATHIRGKVVTMHRLIMNPPNGLWVHHLDDNGLDNCRTGFEKPASWLENRVSESISRMGIVQQGPLDAWKRTWFVKVAVKAKRLPDITTPLSWLAVQIQPDPPARGTQFTFRPF
jgi:hypothetical protein